MSQYEELLAQSIELQAKIEEARKAELAEVVPKIKAMMEQYKITAEDLGFVTPKPKRGASKSKAAAKPLYRSPDGQAWSGGRGPKPQWVQDVLNSGGNIEDYAISEGPDEASSKPAVGAAIDSYGLVD